RFSGEPSDRSWEGGGRSSVVSRQSRVVSRKSQVASRESSVESRVVSRQSRLTTDEAHDLAFRPVPAFPAGLLPDPASVAAVRADAEIDVRVAGDLPVAERL